MDGSTMFWVGVALIVAWMFRGLIVLLVIAAGGMLALGAAFVGICLLDLWDAMCRRLRKKNDEP